MIKKRVKVDIEKFRKFREEHGVTISQIADTLDTKHRTVYSWIDKGWPDDDPSMFDEMSDHLGFSREDLIDKIC